MTAERRKADVTSVSHVEPPPSKPPLEIIEAGADWVLEAYDRGYRTGETFSTHDDQMEALRAAKRRMDDADHPCLLRWDTERSVRNIYWNPNFEELAVRYDDFLSKWVVVPEAGHFLFHADDRRNSACRYARAVQRKYDFKHLSLFARDGEAEREIDHRFVRYSIDESGVRFDREALRGDSDRLDDDENSDEGPRRGRVGGDSGPASALGAAVPDLTEVDVIDGDGPVECYHADWTGDREAVVMTLDSDLSSDEDAIEAFVDAVDQWENIEENSTVASVYDSGTTPVPWVAYRYGEGRLVEVIEEFDRGDRLRILKDVADALDTGTMYGVGPLGVRPDTVHLTGTRGGALADWGLAWSVQRALGRTPVTPFTAPEQLDGETADTTGVYQLGALAHWLLTDTVPYTDAGSMVQSITRGKPPRISDRSDVPVAVDHAVARAMALDPEARYMQAKFFYEELNDAIQ